MLYYFICMNTTMLNTQENTQEFCTVYPITDAVQHAFQLSLQGAKDLLPSEEWLKKLAKSAATGIPLRIKLGLDPTAPDIHLGHTVVLNKLRQLQNLGHTVIFLIGDFTSLIGDPSGRNSTRPPLTVEQIKTNAHTYYQQASLILDPSKTEIRYNSEWCDALGTRGMIQLASRYTLAKMMERDDFTKRYTQNIPISVHEFLYPLIQGYDSVVLHSDLEIGGTDQTFNLLVGRELQKEYQQTQQCILTMPLLEGLDGVEKMSKSKHNYIGITESANTMFAKILSISDELMWRWYPLLSFKDTPTIDRLHKETLAGRNPKEIKVLLAKEITSRFHNMAAADAAEQDFINRSQGGVPENIPIIHVSGAPLGIASLLKLSGLTASNSEGFRLIDGKGVRINSTIISDKQLLLTANPYIIQIGKRKFAKVILN